MSRAADSAVGTHDDFLLKVTPTQRRLTVIPRRVVRSFGEMRAGRERVQSGVRTMKVIVMKIVKKKGNSLVAGVIGACVRPTHG